jgi:hypothetical protein
MKTKAAVMALGILGALGVGAAPSAAGVRADASAGCVDAGILDLGPVWPFRPGARAAGGTGFSIPRPEDPIRGTVGGRPLPIGGERGVSLDATIGAKFVLTKPFMIRVETRYRRRDSLADILDAPSDDVETTASIGWTF